MQLIYNLAESIWDYLSQPVGREDLSLNIEGMLPWEARIFLTDDEKSLMRSEAHRAELAKLMEGCVIVWRSDSYVYCVITRGQTLPFTNTFTNTFAQQHYLKTEKAQIQCLVSRLRDMQTGRCDPCLRIRDHKRDEVLLRQILKDKITYGLDQLMEMSTRTHTFHCSSDLMSGEIYEDSSGYNPHSVEEEVYWFHFGVLENN